MALCRKCLGRHLTLSKKLFNIKPRKGVLGSVAFLDIRVGKRALAPITIG